MKNIIKIASAVLVTCAVVLPVGQAEAYDYRIAGCVVRVDTKVDGLPYVPGMKALQAYSSWLGRHVTSKQAFTCDSEPLDVTSGAYRRLKGLNLSYLTGGRYKLKDSNGNPLIWECIWLGDYEPRTGQLTYGGQDPLRQWTPSIWKHGQCYADDMEGGKQEVCGCELLTFSESIAN